MKTKNNFFRDLKIYLKFLNVKGFFRYFFRRSCCVQFYLVNKKKQVFSPDNV